MGNATRDHRPRDYARNNRKEMNEAEVRIWERVLDVRFRRQHPVGPYILDFACVALRLAIELDGSQHESSPDDAIRDAYLASRGWTTDSVLLAPPAAVNLAPPSLSLRFERSPLRGWTKDRRIASGLSGN